MRKNQNHNHKPDAANAANASTAGANHPVRCIIPSALSHAAKVYVGNPRKLGEILIALATGTGEAGLDEAQRVIVSMCRAALDEREHMREMARERKRRQRERERGGEVRT